MSEPHTPWSDEERAMLRRLRQNGVSLRQCAVMMGRTHHSIQRQARYLHLNLPAKPKAPREGGGKPEPPKRVGTGSTLPPLPSLRTEVRHQWWQEGNQRWCLFCDALQQRRSEDDEWQPCKPECPTDFGIRSANRA